MSNVHSRIRERRKRREEDAEYEYENEYQNEILFLRLGDFLSNVECRMTNVQCQSSKLKAQSSSSDPPPARPSTQIGEKRGNDQCRMTNDQCRMTNRLRKPTTGLYLSHAFTPGAGQNQVYKRLQNGLLYRSRHFCRKWSADFSG